jgi:hypothetical protein
MNWWEHFRFVAIAVLDVGNIFIFNKKIWSRVKNKFYSFCIPLQDFECHNFWGAWRDPSASSGLISHHEHHAGYIASATYLLDLFDFLCDFHTYHFQSTYKIFSLNFLYYQCSPQGLNMAGRIYVFFGVIFSKSFLSYISGLLWTLKAILIA